MILLLACTGTLPGLDTAPTAHSASTDSAPVEDSGIPLQESAVEACGTSALTDVDPADGAVEVSLTASAFAWDPGTGVPLEDGRALAGQVPGPALVATLGDQVTVHFTNDTGAPLALHGHGLRLPVGMDGVEVAVGAAVDLSFTAQDTGLSWLRARTDASTNVEAGLYLPVVVRAPGELPPDCDLVVMLDDVLLDEDTLQLQPAGSTMNRLMGRLGNVLLANGRAARRVSQTPGQTTLLRLGNASNARLFEVYLEGQTLTVVGTDSGFLAEPVTVEHLTLVPGERVMVVVEVTGAAGDEVRLWNRRVPINAVESGMVEADPLGEGENVVMTFVIGEGDANSAGWTPPAPDVPPWTSAVANVGHRWVLGEDMMGGTVTLDGASAPDVPTVSLPGDVDTTLVFENTSDTHHPMHLFGNRFAVVDIDGAAPALPGWKDTVDVAPGSTVTVVSALDNPGRWPVEASIFEHAELGMAGAVEIGE